ncbi:hypothetical protein H6G80_27105 [Nostoc sp. FACHB-87]|uniref:hypothetical protein n=1 Tax=Nostocales TaxID=1161 RepID=UPI001687DF25|nr:MULTISPECIES: hypothetical protein [Nostocales]MBD2457727.1 hypothetical protein [Nostoc sp. FACHB-87]MBD2478810.1 hypothetical protein [Anabaena sp. FACHB-83]MBD2492581.1 hypothetical protein [Aulosira sp. FACHB-615]
MSLLEFIHKWEAPEENRLRLLVTAFFERDERTIRKWMNEQTPRYARWVLDQINKEWERNGRNYAIFFQD